MTNEKELKDYLDNPDTKIKQIMAYTDNMLSDKSPEGQQKVKELSAMLRKARKPRIAAQVAKELYEKGAKTPDNCNLYFVAVVDAGDEKEIEELDKEAERWVKASANDTEESEATPEQRRHLNATRLKAANKLRNNEMFERAYEGIPNEDKTGNNYIVNQYYVYLDRNKRYQKIVEHYKSLNPDVREDTRIQNRYKDAERQVGPSVFLIALKSSEAALLSPDVILQTLRVRVVKITGERDEILQEMGNSGSRFAVVWGTQFDQFTWGYFFGKMGVSNLIVLTDEGEDESAIPDFAGQKPYHLSGTLEVLMAKKQEIANRMRASGLSVYSG